MTGPTTDSPADSSESLPLLLGRSAVGGSLMGLANLVPGISGGTMLLAAGIYPRFIAAIADVTTLRLRAPSIAILAGVVGSAGLAILLFAGPVKDLVVGYRWAMYSLFVGLTLGGVPVVRRLIGPMTPQAYGGVIVGFAGMATLAWVQAQGVTAVGGEGASPLMFLLAGVAGASAMILPGVSGGYLLLVMGMYVPILAGVDAFKEGLSSADIDLLWRPTLDVVIPVGIGVVGGVVAVSNLLRWLLRAYAKQTLGVLLGLLLGAVVGLWPFQQGVQPEIGAVWKGQEVTAAFLEELEPEDYPTQWFRPTAGQVGGSVLLIAVGLGLTLGIARWSHKEGGEQDDLR
ncbi:MAG: DUF368 domain-containing protein [Myxococcales bacterium]|nr:DUF368 domain-containing protein [Myxococcales bacterium]